MKTFVNGSVGTHYLRAKIQGIPLKNGCQPDERLTDESYK